MPENKYIFALRHAKALAGNPSQNDHERALATRGLAEAGLVGEYLKNNNLSADRVLCSTSLRTRQTYEQACAALGNSLPVEFIQKLYLAEESDILAQIHTLGDDVTNVMLIGHNPGLHLFVLRMATSGDSAAMDDVSLHFPTSALACLRLPAKPWAMYDFGDAYLERFTVPRSE